MASESDLVLVEVVRDVAILTWNRPERNNAWSVPLELAYFEALQAAEADPGVRAIVVTGAGRSFCPGMDGQMLSDVAAGSTDTRPQDRAPQTLPTTINKPIVAAINGACAGIGLIQALFCDVRFAASGVKFTTAFARRGIMAEHGIAWMLPRVVGMGNAMDLLLSARVVLAEEAAQMGLVNRVVAPEDLLSTAIDYAADLAANCSPAAMAAIKQQLYAAGEQTLDEARLDAINLWFTRLKPHSDFKEGIGSFLERRPPAFAPWDAQSATSAAAPATSA